MENPVTLSRYSKKEWDRACDTILRNTSIKVTGATGERGNIIINLYQKRGIEITMDWFLREQKSLTVHPRSLEKFRKALQPKAQPATRKRK